MPKHLCILSYFISELNRNSFSIPRFVVYPPEKLITLRGAGLSEAIKKANGVP